MWETGVKTTPRGALKKGVRHLHLPFLGLYVESPLIFFVTKKKRKKRKKRIYKVHTWIIQPLINLNELQFDKMKYTWLRFLDYNLVKDYKALFPRLQSKKKKEKKRKEDNALSYKPKSRFGG